MPFVGISAGLFAALSRLRGKRFFHPRGVSYIARFSSSDDDLLPVRDSREAIVRLSKGAGLPDPYPDVLGLAIKIRASGERTSDQDLLLASSLPQPVLRNMLIPSFSFFTPIYSSVLPYRNGDRQVVIGARARPSLRGRPGRMENLDEQVALGDVAFDLLVAELAGAWQRIGSLKLSERCSEEVAQGLRFNPWNTGPELEPAGPLNTLRRSSYLASQKARPS